MAEDSGGGGGWQSSAITAAASLIAGEMGRGYSAGANKLNRKTMQRQFRLNRMMRATAVRDRMADMRAAGINPILAGKYDADSPGVSALSAINPAVGAGALGTAGANIVSTAVQAAKTRKETEMIDKMMSSAEVQEDLMDYMQGHSSKIDAITEKITDGIGSTVKMGYDAMEAFKEQLKVMADDVSKMAGSVERKVQEFKQNARDIYINLKQDFNDFVGIDAEVSQ